MEKIESIEQIQELISKVRSKRKGFLTNFYLDESKLAVWISMDALFFNTVGDTLFIVRKKELFWNVFYVSVGIDELERGIIALENEFPLVKLVFDVVGRKAQTKQVLDGFNKLGFSLSSELIRMSRCLPLTERVAAYNVTFANREHVEVIHRSLFRFFDDVTEQLPYKEEIEQYVALGRVLVYIEGGTIGGFLIFELKPSTLYLRYWLTLPEFRNRKVGSQLMNRFFDLGKSTKRQILWVKNDNVTAITRYRHYGFDEEDMYDYVLTNKNNPNMREKIIDILTELRPEFDFGQEKNFIEEGMLDSFDIVSLVSELDATYGISIDGMDIVPDNFTSIEAIEQLVLKNGAK